MPHRKWRLEFSAEAFPGYAELAGNGVQPPESAYRITCPFALPGTSEQVMLLTMPMHDEKGTFLGICGYEISASYFMTYHAQPTVLHHLSCLLAFGQGDVLIPANTLHCGTADGYFHKLGEDYTIIHKDGRLTHFKSEKFSYLGLTEPLSIAAGNSEFLLAVMIPREDYDADLSRSTAKNVILILLLVFFTVSFCRFFSRRFLSPLLGALEQIKSDKRAGSDIPEIHDLIDYLDRQDKAHDETLAAAENEKLRLKSELERLAYSRKNEIDPADYEFFKKGLETLTKSERNLFEHYLAGKSVPEILELTGIKESTLKYHNHNLLGKLGVSSRKQMLRYAEIMRQQGEEGIPK
ncbi:MAG: LuxR family transcriptional regulator [Ruminococcaceae bacterium]|nr:LuxR family transcriptional regulator [Oscillospiraceae bacterium]